MWHTVQCMRVEHNKLVRDHIPAIIHANGAQAITRVLDDEEYTRALVVKLVEEAQEARDTSADELPYELADVLEVLLALSQAVGMSWSELTSIAAKKRRVRGGFGDRVFLEYVE